MALLGAALPPETGLWYCEATLMLDERVLRAGTLIQCARRWQSLSDEEKQRALVRLALPVDGENVLQHEAIAALTQRPSFRFA